MNQWSEYKATPLYLWFMEELVDGWVAQRAVDHQSGSLNCLVHGQCLITYCPLPYWEIFDTKHTQYSCLWILVVSILWVSRYPLNIQHWWSRSIALAAASILLPQNALGIRLAWKGSCMFYILHLHLISEVFDHIWQLMYSGCQLYLTESEI